MQYWEITKGVFQDDLQALEEWTDTYACIKSVREKYEVETEKLYKKFQRLKDEYDETISKVLKEED